MKMCIDKRGVVHALNTTSLRTTACGVQRMYRTIQNGEWKNKRWKLHKDDVVTCLWCACKKPRWL